MTYSLRSTPVGSTSALWMDTIAAWGDLSVTWTWGGDIGGGLGEATWSMDLPYNFDHPALRRGAFVELMDGALPVGCGLLAEPGRTDTGLSFRVPGIQREAEYVPALTSAGDSTTTADTAIDNAIATFGLPWSRPNTISNAALTTGDVTEGLNYLDTLLTGLAQASGTRWWLDGQAVVHINADPTTPTWQLVPGVIDFAVADDSYASTLIGRYINTSGVYTSTAPQIDAAAQARFGTRVYVVDLTPYGKINSTRATNFTAALLSRGKSRLTFTDRVEVTSDQLLTIDGGPAALSLVRGGQMVRAHGVVDVLTGLNYIDFVLGEVVDPQDGQTITIAPVDLGARSLADNFAVAATDRRFAA